jgi:hypothetical protein
MSATHLRPGAFLGAIPPCRRIGDYVHAACRIAKALFKRLGDMAKANNRHLYAALKDFMQEVSWDAMQGSSPSPNDSG